MLRRYTVKAFFEKVRLAREIIPDIGLSTDVIVAFPGETREEYEETLDVMRAIRFDDAYTYKYSPREGTPAVRLPASDFVSDEEGQERLARLIEVHRAIQAEINEAEVGRTEEVLVEKQARGPGQILGRTSRNKVVAFTGSTELVGTYQEVCLTETTGATFVGELAAARALTGSA
jgi:tRNA-2-methylthio-N6-dimethylallyladenosine synthase